MMQKIIELYRRQTGKVEFHFADVAEFAKKQGVEMPVPKTPEELLIKELTSAAREEMGRDEKTGRPFRVYHALPITQGGQTTYAYFSVEDANRSQMHRSLQKRREQMVDDAMKLVNDADHWNNINPKDEPIQMELDLGFDVELRRADEDDDDEAA